MTREERLDWLCRLRSEIYVFMPKEWLKPMDEALTDSIKALEQVDILDKIKAEMEALASHRIRPISFDQAVAVNMCINIIDKYRQEGQT